MLRSHAVIALVLAGCASSTPNLHSLDQQPGPVRSRLPAVILVRSVSLPRYLDRQEIVRGIGARRLAARDNDWWAEPLRVMTRRFLVADIAQRLPHTDVLAEDGVIPVRPDAQIDVDLQRFELDEVNRVILEGYVSVTLGTRPRVLERFLIDVPTQGGTIGHQVEAMSVALGRAADLIARRLAP